MIGSYDSAWLADLVTGYLMEKAKEDNHFENTHFFGMYCDGGNLVFTGNYTFVDDQYVTVFNDDIETIESYEQFNARIAWQPASAKYEVAIYGQNLTDELSYANDYSVSALDDGVRRTGRPISPRLYGLEAAIFF